MDLASQAAYSRFVRHFALLVVVERPLKVALAILARKFHSLSLQINGCVVVALEE